jgi:acetyl esterase/lipase
MLLFVCVWIVLPAPNLPLLALGVGSPEISPVLLVAAIVLSAIAAAKARRMPIARLALVLGLVAACIAVVPIVQALTAIRELDAAMRRVAGPEHHRMRSHPIHVAGLFKQTDPGRATITPEIEFARPDGVPLRLIVYQPVDATAGASLPIVVQIYGGGWRSGSPQDYAWFARYMAAHGYLVVAVDYRHAPKWRWPEQLEDVRAGLRWVAEHGTSYRGDPSRIALVGRSSGAQLAMRMAYQEAPSAIKAVVNFYGPVDLADGWRRPPHPDPLGVRSVLETFLGGTPDQIPDRYKHASPITYSQGRVPPTLHLYGRRDHIVEARFGRIIDQSLKEAGNTSVLLEFPWSEHAFDLIPNGLGAQISLYYVERFIAWAVGR